MRISLIVILMLFLITGVRAQGLSRKNADSLLRTFEQLKSDTDRINQLLDVSAFIIFKPGELKIDLDSAVKLIARAKSINTSVKSNDVAGRIMFTESLLFREQGHAAEAKKILINAIQIFKNNNDDYFLGRSYLSMADLYDYKDPKNMGEKIRLVQQAIVSFRKSKYIERMAFSLKVLGDLYESNIESIKALQALKLALAAYDPKNYFALQAVYDLMGKVYYRLRDYKQAMKYELLAIKTSELAKDSGMQFCAINNTMALIYLGLKDNKMAIFYFKKALLIAEAHHDKSNIDLVATNLVDAFIRVNKPEDALLLMNNLPGISAPANGQYDDCLINGAYLTIYTGLKSFKRANIYAEKLKHLIKGNQIEKVNLCKVYFQLIKFYTASDKYTAAIKYLKINRTLTKAIGDPYIVALNHKLWCEFDTMRGNYKSAFFHLQTYNRLEDSIINENKSRQIQELQVAYETSEKEKDIQQLQDGAKLQKTALAQSNQSRNFYSGGVAMLLLVLVFGFSRYRIKQQANAQLLIKQAEITEKNEDLGRLLRDNEWLLREVHHRVKNNLQIVMSLLNSQSAYLEDEKASSAIMESQHRVNAMSLIHQKLYKSSNVSNIFMPEYINELVDYLKESFNTGHNIQFKVEIDPINLDVLHAIPLGLILNEVITNSIKYAFPKGLDDTINITLSAISFYEVIMIVEDNGKGLPEDFETGKKNSFGFTLINGLTEELGGQMTIKKEHGTQLTFLFKTDPPGPLPII